MILKPPKQPTASVSVPSINFDLKGEIQSFGIQGFA
jgi:hypothetical protein